MNTNKSRELNSSRWFPYAHRECFVHSQRFVCLFCISKKHHFPYFYSQPRRSWLRVFYKKKPCREVSGKGNRLENINARNQSIQLVTNQIKIDIPRLYSSHHGSHNNIDRRNQIDPQKKERKRIFLSHIKPCFCPSLLLLLINNLNLRFCSPQTPTHDSQPVIMIPRKKTETIFFEDQLKITKHLKCISSLLLLLGVFFGWLN